MSRLGVPGLAARHPVGTLLPALYDDDGLAAAFTGAFDELLAPVQSTLDCLTAYVDAGQAPDDFVDWLAGWVGAPFDRWMPLWRRRQVLDATGELHRLRGTAAGVVRLLQVTLGATEVEVEGGGGTWWSTDPGASVPEEMAAVVVRATVPAGEPEAQERAERLVATAVPAHVPFRVEVTPGGAVPELRE